MTEEQEWGSYYDLQSESEELPKLVSADSAVAPPAVAQWGSLGDLAKGLCLPESTLQEIDELVRDKRQMVFTGPPGTGKTYVARQLAAYYAGGDENRVEFLQFHPSYSYEDFVEGYRPTLKDGALTYSVEDGPLMLLVRKAAEAYEEDGEDAPPFVMVIDELNRANLGRVFGELFFALEYRDETVRRQYKPKDEPLRLPRNLWFIGTMNTADRSIALFDAALRRRFYFYDFSPSNPAVSGMLTDFLTANEKEDLLWLVEALQQVNGSLPDPRFAVGPSYFMRKDLTEDLAKRAWEYTVLPYLKDRFEAIVDTGDFGWEALRSLYGPGEVAPDDTEEADAETSPQSDPMSGETSEVAPADPATGPGPQDGGSD